MCTGNFSGRYLEGRDSPPEPIECYGCHGDCDECPLIERKPARICEGCGADASEEEGGDGVLCRRCLNGEEDGDGVQ